MEKNRIIFLSHLNSPPTRTHTLTHLHTYIVVNIEAKRLNIKHCFSRDVLTSILGIHRKFY